MCSATKRSSGIAAVKEGARQVECTINGIGERAGNCSLEEIVMILNCRLYTSDAADDMQSKRLCQPSRLISNTTGMHVQRNKAIVGHRGS